MTVPPDSQDRAAPWDGLAGELQALRRGVGDPSYAEISRRITEQRLARGLSPHAARVARTTVYDCFRTGRARVNLAFVREIVQSLGGEGTLVDEWVARYRAPPPSAVDPLPPTPADAEVVAAHPSGLRQLALLVAACVGLNLLGRLVVDYLALPIYLDMAGTAIAAIALGPWRGALVGGTTNLVGVLISGAVSLPFALVNVTGALLWGYGVRRFGFGRTLPRFFLLNVIVAVACTLVAVPILMAFGGSTGHGEDSVTDTLFGLTQTLLVSVGFANLLVSLADKLITGFLALVAVSALPAGLRLGLQLTLMSPSAAAAENRQR